MEIWLDIPGYEGKYFISNKGRLRNQTREIKPMTCSNGYLSACLWKNNRQKKFLVHRLVAELFLENKFQLSDVNHKDENKTNNDVSNLEWCTHAYNMNYGTIRERIGNAHRGKPLSPEHREKCASAKGRRWVQKNDLEKLVRKEEIPSFLLDGYKLGRVINVRESESMSCRQNRR